MGAGVTLLLRDGAPLEGERIRTNQSEAPPRRAPDSLALLPMAIPTEILAS